MKRNRWVLPTKSDQIIKAHAALIYSVAHACHNKIPPAQLESMLQFVSQQGWTQLVAVIRKILAGSRDVSLLNSLDEEDRIIGEAILRGIQDPSTLPDPNAPADPTLAAPGLAAMIHAAASEPNALKALSLMAEQMVQIGGDMARLGGVMGRLVHGERDPELLSKGMGKLGRSLVLAILDELAKLVAH